MFDLGTKITVLASTQKNGAGPRKGSIGHIVDIQGNHSIDSNMFAVSCVVHFNRFGFEQKSRSEVRTVINLLQMINNSNEADVPKQVDMFHNFFNSAKFDDMISRIIDYTQANSSTSIVIMTPYNEIDDDILTCANSEFESWARMISLVIGPSLYQINTGSNYICTNNPHMSKKKIQRLGNIFNSRSERDSYIKDITGSIEERRDFVLTVRYLLSTQYSSSHVSRCKVARDFINHELHHTYSNSRPTHDTAKAIYRLLYNNLYNVSFKRITDLFSERPSGECIKNTILMKSTLKSMSEKLLSENTSN